MLVVKIQVRKNEELIWISEGVYTDLALQYLSLILNLLKLVIVRY